MWCEVDDASPMMLHNVYTYGTDHPLNHPPQAYYIGSYQYEEHQLVFHTYFLSGEEIYRQKAQAQDTLNTLQATFSLKDYPQEYPDQDPPEAA